MNDDVSVGPKRWRPILRFACRLGLVASIPLIAIIAIRATANDCTHTLVEESRSSDGRWNAQMFETFCDLPLVMDVADDVRLVSIKNPSDSATILGVDTGGPDERPRLVWTAPDVLRVTVPNLSYLKIDTRNFEGVHIDPRYDPDDPVARAEWRRQLGEPPDLDKPD